MACKYPITYTLLKHVLQIWSHLVTILTHLEHIGNDKEVGKDLPLLPHCKQSNDPGETHHRNKDDGGLEQTSLVMWFKKV